MILSPSPIHDITRLLPENQSVWEAHLLSIARIKKECQEMPEPYKGSECHRLYNTEINLHHTLSFMESEIFYNCEICGLATNGKSRLELIVEGKRTCPICRILHDFKVEKTQMGRHKIIINQSIYNDGGNVEKPNGQFLGFGGRRHIILMNTGERIVTNNLWTAGTVPWKYREFFPDNARFA